MDLVEVTHLKPLGLNKNKTTNTLGKPINVFGNISYGTRKRQAKT